MNLWYGVHVLFILSMVGKNSTLSYICMYTSLQAAGIAGRDKARFPLRDLDRTDGLMNHGARLTALIENRVNGKPAKNLWSIHNK